MQRIACLVWSSICSLLLSSITGPAAAQEFPSRTIRWVVANTPGSSSDAVARIVAAELPKFLGQAVVVENRPGGNSTIGWEYVAKQAPADGHTLALGFPTGLASLPFIVKELRFDPIKDLPPVTTLGEGRLLLASAAQLPWKTLNEMIAYGKANPGKLNFGAADPSIRLSNEGILQHFALDVVFVPYSGGAGYLQGIVSGEIHLGLASAGGLRPFSEKIRILAITGAQRSASLKDVPTFSELGLPLVPGTSYSMNVPAATPRSVIDKLHAAASRALQQPEVTSRFAGLQIEVVNDSPETAAKYLASNGKVFADVANKIGLKPQ